MKSAFMNISSSKTKLLNFITFLSVLVSVVGCNAPRTIFLRNQTGQSIVLNIIDEEKIIFNTSPGKIVLDAKKSQRDTILTLGSGQWGRQDKGKILDLISRSIPDGAIRADKDIRVNRVNIFVNELYVRIRKSQ